MSGWRPNFGSMLRSPRWGTDADTHAAALLPSVVGRQASSGQPLDTASRETMETRFAHDFSHVRIHADQKAAAAADAINARAYTTGSHVVFGQDQFRPRADDGQRLIAHELAHVVHNDSASTVEPRISQAGEPVERAADRMAHAALTGTQPGPQPAPRSVPAFARQPAGGTSTDFQLRPSPWFMRSMGHLVIDGFVTGQATLSDRQRDQIVAHAATLRSLIEMEPGGRITVTGHGDAVGTETRNQELGMARAEAVRSVLIEAGIAASLIDVDRAGESDPAIPSPGAEPRNRRAVIGFSPALRLPGFGMPGLRPPSLMPNTRPQPDLRLHRDPSQPLPPVGGSPQPLPPWFWRPIPPAPPRTANGLRQFFERDPLLRLLPQPLRDWALSGLEHAPEGIAGAIANQLPFEGEMREAVDATLRALARYMMGESWSPPPSRDPRFDMPPAQSFPSAPGQTIISSPTIRF
jgi:outer membrane protein OmpA-like peptidoglycan-associated protein